MSGWIKNILSTEQKKSDFRPEEHGVGLVERTTVLNCYQSCKENSSSVVIGEGLRRLHWVFDRAGSGYRGRGLQAILAHNPPPPQE